MKLSICKWQYALVYLDEVIFYSKSRWEHFGHLLTVLNLLTEADTSLKLKKSGFSKTLSITWAT